MFCFHKWKVISVSIAPSFIDKCHQNGIRRLSEVSEYMFERDKIVVLKCQKCGMLKQKKMDESAMIMYESEEAICGCVPSNVIGE